MIGWAVALLGSALAGPPEAHAHGDHCPVAPALASAVVERPLQAAERRCVAEAVLETARGNAYGWVGLVDAARHGGPPLSEEAVRRLQSHVAQAEAPLRAAEALQGHPEARQLAVEAVAAWLTTQPWSTPWSGAHARLRSLDPARAEATQPRAPLAADLTACRDVGRLQSRALFGGVYATERDCVVRAVEVSEGLQRQAWADLAWALTVTHGVDDERVVVRQRLEVLGVSPGVSASPQPTP